MVATQHQKPFYNTCSRSALSQYYRQLHWADFPGTWLLPRTPIITHRSPTEDVHLRHFLFHLLFCYTEQSPSVLGQLVPVRVEGKGQPIVTSHCSGLPLPPLPMTQFQAVQLDYSSH